jgi:tripartite-type tricarboxylate transporter receptor subunit TctC
MERMCRIARQVVVTSVVAAIAVWAMSPSASAQSSDAIAEHFRGKTVRLVIATGTGGAYGGYGLVFAQYFGKHIPGEPAVVPEYRPGAGGVVAANYLYNVAPKDGTVIGLPLAPIVLAQYTGAKAQYDASKFLWVGQMADITRLFAVWETSPIKTFQDLQTMESVAGTTGRGSETYMNPALMNHVFGTKIKIVSGYKGSNSLMLALERGEISAVSGTWSNFAANHPHWLREKKVRFIVQIGLSKVKGYEQVPLLSDLAKTEDDRRLVEYMSLVTTSVGYSIIAPPGLPDPIIAALRTAFDATMKDPAFLAAAKKCCVDLSPATHQAVAAAVGRATEAPKSLLERFIKATAP